MENTALDKTQSESKIMRMFRMVKSTPKRYMARVRQDHDTNSAEGYAPPIVKLARWLLTPRLRNTNGGKRTVWIVFLVSDLIIQVLMGIVYAYIVLTIAAWVLLVTVGPFIV